MGQTHNAPKQHINHLPYKIGVHQLAWVRLPHPAPLVLAFLLLGARKSVCLFPAAECVNWKQHHCLLSLWWIWGGSLFKKVMLIQGSWITRFCFVTLTLYTLGKPLVAPPLAPDASCQWRQLSCVSEAAPSFTSTILPFCSAKDLPESEPGILFGRSFIVLALTCTGLETGNNVERWLHFSDEQAMAQSDRVIATASNENEVSAHSLLLRYTQK